MFEKECKLCGEVKPLSEFYSQNKTRVDGTLYIYYHLDCKECAIEKAKKWQKENPERCLINMKRHQATQKGKISKRRTSNKRTKNGKSRKWQQENRDKIRQYNLNRTMHKKHEISKDEWENCKNYFNYRCAYCGLPIEEHYRLWRGEMKQFDLHKEHADDNGANDLSNCIPSCQSCNSSKGNYSLNEWYNENNYSFSQEKLNKINLWLESDYKKYINKK